MRDLFVQVAVKTQLAIEYLRWRAALMLWVEMRDLKGKVGLTLFTCDAVKSMRCDARAKVSTRRKLKRYCDTGEDEMK